MNQRTLFVLTFSCFATLGLQAGSVAIVNGLIMPMTSEAEEPAFNGYVVIAEDGTVEATGPGKPGDEISADKIIDVNGSFVLPGFISAHSHLWQSALRGLGANETLFGWAEAVYDEHAQYATPDDAYWFTLHGALDHMRNGITGAYNFNLGGYYSEGPFAERQLDAELDSGIRFVHGYSLGWKQSEDPDGAMATQRLEDFLGYVENKGESNKLLSVMLNGGGSFRDDKAFALLEGQIMRDLGLSNHTHYLEAPDHKYVMQAKFPWFEEAGSLNEQMIWGHFIHTTPEILRKTADAGAKMTWNPLSNGRLASGTADIPLYREMGIPVGMGVDGQASADLADPLANARTGLYAIRALYESAKIMSAYDVLWLHTQGSADVLGVGDRLGSLAIGKEADIVVYDPNRWDVAPVTDPYATLVFAMDSRHLDRVFLDGDLVYHKGKLVYHDFEAIAAEVAERFQALVARREATAAEEKKSWKDE